MDTTVATAPAQEICRDTLLEKYAKGDEAVKARKAMAKYIHEFIQNTRSGALGVTGSVLLIFAAIR